MGKVVIGMTMPIDGFINDRSGSVDALYPDLIALRDTGPLRESLLSSADIRSHLSASKKNSKGGRQVNIYLRDRWHRKCHRTSNSGCRRQRCYRYRCREHCAAMP